MMSHEFVRVDRPVEVVATSQRGMLEAVRQALWGAAQTMGGLDRCEATILPQVVRDGSDLQYQIMLSVTKRVSDHPGGS